MQKERLYWWTCQHSLAAAFFIVGLNVCLVFPLAYALTGGRDWVSAQLDSVPPRRPETREPRTIIRQRLPVAGGETTHTGGTMRKDRRPTDEKQELAEARALGTLSWDPEEPTHDDPSAQPALEANASRRR